ncbi:MAG: peptidoglycan-binding protein [Pseudomonadota bacterium]
MPKPKAKADTRSRFEDEDDRRGVLAFLIRPLLNSPKDALAILVAAAMVAAIIGNALFMQAGRHPSPMFGRAGPVAFPAAAVAVTPVNPMPKARPLEADAKPAEVRAAEARPPAQPEPRANDPMGQLVARTIASSPSPATVPAMRPPAPIPTAAKADPAAAQRRIAAVQRTLTDFGYAQLRPTGVAGTDTQAAIMKFEKERKLPVTGQVSDRLVRELSAVTGRPIE